MSAVYISGIGAVSPAGWNATALCSALKVTQAFLPVPNNTGRNACVTAPLPRPGTDKPLSIRPVPECKPRPAILAHPRLRRTSPVSHFTASAAMEALGAYTESERLGIIVCLQSGCVHYADRFFGETLDNPATASPLIFPETVLSAPVSHLAAALKNVQLTQTLVGDPGTYLQCLAMGAEWLLAGAVDRCLVIGAEEASWLVSYAFGFWDSNWIMSSGAGALCLTLDPKTGMGVTLEGITDSHFYTEKQTRLKAATQMRSQLPQTVPNALLCDGLQNLHATDAPERAAWNDWKGSRLSPKLILGDGLCAASAWQCVAACHAIASESFSTALVSVVGCNQQAIGAQFSRQTR